MTPLCRSVGHQEIESFVRRNGVKPDSMKALRKVRQLKDQLLQHRLTETRDRQLVRLKQWEDDINALCSDSARITVENTVDLALPPDDFIYKNDYVVGGVGQRGRGLDGRTQRGGEPDRRIVALVL